MGLLREFKTFIMRGNVLDMAIGVVMGSAFGAIINSLVEDVITPVLGLATAGVDFKNLSVTIGQSPDGVPLMIKYGNFINTIIKFILIALCIFLIVKGINHVHKMAQRKKEAEEATAEPEIKELDVLKEILATLKADQEPQA